MPIRESPRKNYATQKKKDKQPERVVDLEAKEGQGTEDIDAKGLEPFTKLLDYIPLHKGKTKVTKDLDFDKFVISTPLFPEQVPFEGLCLMQIPMLKMEYWDLMDHEWFPHLATTNYMKHVYYPDSGVTELEIVEWICKVENYGLLSLLWVPNYHRTTIITTCVRQLLTLVHDGCLWLGVHIPITYMLIHRITHLPHEGFSLAKEFGKKAG